MDNIQKIVGVAFSSDRKTEKLNKKITKRMRRREDKEETGQLTTKGKN